MQPDGCGLGREQGLMKKILTTFNTNKMIAGIKFKTLDNSTSKKIY